MAEEQQEEAEKTSPLKIVEERIYFIQGCLDEDPENEDLYNKHEEYFDLYDQLQEVSKKLKRIEKLMVQQPSTKLEKKRLQYIRNIEETIQYVLNDDFFLPPQAEEEVEEGNNKRVDFRNCLVRVSSCLGQPLESIIEMPGMEGSERYTVSSRNLPGTASANTGSSSTLSAGMQSSMNRLQASAEKGLDLVQEEESEDPDEPLVSPFTMRGRKNLRQLSQQFSENDGLHMSDDDIDFEAGSDEESVSSVEE